MTGDAVETSRLAAERVARDSHGRLVALLAARCRDLAAAEDALAEAFGQALRLWPQQGIPDRPEAWLLTVARRRLGHDRRHAGVIAAALPELLALTEGATAEAPDVSAALPDRRLSLMLVCAHPAIDPAMHTPLMLQTVLGLDAARIAAAFLVPPATMGQRLVRTKARIRDAGLRWAEPEPEDLPQRLPAVLTAVYAAYGTAWDSAPGAEDPAGLAEEALHLGRILVQILPEEPEVLGLMALMLFLQSREPARRAPGGAYVPLDAQQTRLWYRRCLLQAEALLTRAARLRRPGRFQTEAAIQSLHAQRLILGPRPDQPSALALLHDWLLAQAPGLGVAVARAAAHAGWTGPATGLEALAALAAERPDALEYQPFWALRAALLAESGEADAAAEAYAQAIRLARDPAIRAWLEARAQALGLTESTGQSGSQSR